MNFSHILPFFLLMSGLFVGSKARRTNYCDKGWYGYDCRTACHCRAEACDGDGQCERYGCAPEWTGRSCNRRKQNATITYQCINADDGVKRLKVTIQTHGVFYRDVSAVDENRVEQTWCWDTDVSSLHKPRDVITVNVKLTQRARMDMRIGKCAGKMIEDDIYEWFLTIREWKKVTLGLQQNVQIRCNFNKSETHTRHTNITPKEQWTVPFTKAQEIRDNVELVLLDAVTRREVSTVPIGYPVVLQMRYEHPIKSISPHNCYVTSANHDRWQEIVDYNGCNVTVSPVQPFVKSSDINAVETPWFPYFAYDGSPHTQYQCSYKICYDSTCELGCTRRRHIRSASDSDGVALTAFP